MRTTIALLVTLLLLIPVTSDATRPSGAAKRLRASALLAERCPCDGKRRDDGSIRPWRSRGDYLRCVLRLRWEVRRRGGGKARDLFRCALRSSCGLHRTILCCGDEGFLTRDVDACTAEGGRVVRSGSVCDGCVTTTTTSTSSTSTTSTSTLPPCGNGVLDPGEQCDGVEGVPPGGQIACHPPGTPLECLLDFAAVPQLYCNGTCTWAGSNGCDQADADVYCRLATASPTATATGFAVSVALPAPGFSCRGYGMNLGPMPTHGVDADVWYQPTSVRANHGAGMVVESAACQP